MTPDEEFDPPGTEEGDKELHDRACQVFAAFNNYIDED